MGKEIQKLAERYFVKHPGHYAVFNRIQFTAKQATGLAEMHAAQEVVDVLTGLYDLCDQGNLTLDTLDRLRNDWREKLQKLQDEAPYHHKR